MPRAPVVPGRPLTQGSIVGDDEALEALIAAYREAEDDLRRELERLIDRVILDPDSTARYRRDQVRGVLARLATVRAELEGQAVLFRDETLARIYVEGMTSSQRILGLAGSPSFTAVHEAALQVIAADAFDDLAAATQFMDDAAKRVIREATKARTALGAAAGRTVDQDTRALVRELSRRGVTGFVDKAGRNWRISSYAEMVVRTKSAHAYNTGTILRAEEAGTSAMVILDGERSRHDECLTYNRRTCTPAWALANPTLHPNCVRAFGPLPQHTGPVDYGDRSDPPAATIVRQVVPDD